MEVALTTVRNRYKEEIKSLSEDLEHEKLSKSELQTAHRHLTHELEMLKVKSKFEGLDPSWNTFKTQLENKVKDLTKPMKRLYWLIVIHKSESVHSYHRYEL